MSAPDGYDLDVRDHEVAEGSELSTELAAFWREHGGLDAEAVRARLPHVLCVLRDEARGIVATSSAVDGAVAQVGNRRFWIYRCLSPSDAARKAVEPMLLAAREQLTGRVGVDGVRPLGLCFPISDARLIAERDEAVWPRSGMLFAGWTPQGEQLRICYFDGARILP